MLSGVISRGFLRSSNEKYLQGRRCNKSHETTGRCLHWFSEAEAASTMNTKPFYSLIWLSTPFLFIPVGTFSYLWGQQFKDTKELVTSFSGLKMTPHDSVSPCFHKELGDQTLDLIHGKHVIFHWATSKVKELQRTQTWLSMRCESDLMSVQIGTHVYRMLCFHPQPDFSDHFHWVCKVCFIYTNNCEWLRWAVNANFIYKCQMAH